MLSERSESKRDNNFDFIFRVYTKILNLKKIPLINYGVYYNEKDLHDEDFYYDEEDSVEECEHFKLNFYKGNEILSMKEEVSLEKFNEEGIMLGILPLLTKLWTYKWWIKKKILQCHQ